jgi:hypothetical protein
MLGLADLALYAADAAAIKRFLIPRSPCGRALRPVVELVEGTCRQCT